VAGVKYSYEKSEVTDMPDKERDSNNRFQIDILQLNIGILSIYDYLKSGKII